MIKLKEFKELNISITWTLIDIGFKGSEIFHDELNAHEIIEYAISLLEQDYYSEEVAELAGESEKNICQIDEYIKRLSSKEDKNRDKELQKWAVCYVNHHIKRKYDNYMDGLIELGDIWIKLGMPKDSPHVFQGVNNNISPAEYYTAENYNDLYKRNVIWVKNKLLDLQLNT